MQQTVRRLHLGKDVVHDVRHADLVHGAHVVNIDPMLGDLFPLARIDGADTDLKDVLGINQRPSGLEIGANSASPQKNATGMPCMLPDGEVTGELKSACASSHRTKSGRP